MAIQFPPINEGDPLPENGDTYLYVTTQEEFVYHRPTNSWSVKGVINDSTFAFQGTLEIQQPAPTNAETGFIYSVIDGGIADPSFNGLAGQPVEQWSLVIFTGSDWVLVSAAATSPWIRTANGQIQPIVQTDNLDMVDGSYAIESLEPLQ